VTEAGASPIDDDVLFAAADLDSASSGLHRAM
jgi:hypothetical protein